MAATAATATAATNSPPRFSDADVPRLLKIAYNYHLDYARDWLAKPTTSRATFSLRYMDTGENTVILKERFDSIRIESETELPREEVLAREKGMAWRETLQHIGIDRRK